MTGKAAELDRIYAEYARTPVLQQLAAGRRLVRGAGPLDSPMAVIGEAPGEDEERSGEPFTGPCGKLLKKMFTVAGLPWDLCYRTNTVPWRPPGNRTPYPFEIANSAGRLHAEIGIVGAEVVVAVGAVAWDAFSPPGHGLGWFHEHRGQLLVFDDLPYRLLGIYHPGYILRMPGRQRGEVEDETVTALQSVLAAAGA
jgi:DNA polymerase